MSNKEKMSTVQSLLAGMYVEFKNKSFADPLSDSEVLEEMGRLESIDILTLISYVDSLFEILTSLKLDETKSLVQ